ncbi:flagellar capping protein [Halobacillus halophilus]|uniref:Flagellar hook-associated protein 2 n=1 Tax=Halobacillus halophilus (strain ATCC 35676 / DSM 2266 / JCM 20832 / KCTC 3685 / LMG 17431 / NBRC 102448 / NCIMB 2269) TaxID=866895 RepID=I0JQJ9_HALH3|nr:flagellar hook-associated protein 2 [Halobacillus halophilus]ASF40431.1 flagellar capping protein [Halobacillus halophilus]CCG46419.1 flagellar capping protein [Halobacillus halophilus DSM 2266]
MSDMRIGGLASGMDTDKIINDLMRAERQPLNKMEQDKKWMTWQRDAYRDVNKQLNQLDTLAFDMKLERTFNSKNVTSSNSAVSATASSSAGTGDYTLSVEKTATAAYNYSESTISKAGASFDPDAKLSSEQVNLKNKLTLGQSFSVTTYNEDGTKNEKTFEVTGDKSLNNILSEISDSDLGVRAFYDKSADKVMIERTETGNFNPEDSGEFLGAEIGFNGSDEFLSTTLGIKNGDNSTGTWKKAERGGTDAEFTYNNGLKITTHSNNYTLNGVNFTFNDVTDGNIKVNVKNDVDQAVDKIVEFVDKYNKIIEELNGKTEEKKYREFPPLTDKQKEDMEEKEIELWNEKAKSGLLRNDSVLENGLSSMRTNWYTPVENNGDFELMSEIGITTSSNYREGGKLLINEDELRKALSTDPESVHKLFAGTEEKPGVARRIENSIETTISSIERKAGKSTTLDNNFLLGRRIKDMDDQMERFEERLTQLEDRYWAQFGAMESAIQKMNSQSAYLMQNFG